VLGEKGRRAEEEEEGIPKSIKEGPCEEKTNNERRGGEISEGSAQPRIRASTSKEGDMEIVWQRRSLRITHQKLDRGDGTDKGEKVFRDVVKINRKRGISRAASGRGRRTIC